RLRVPGVKGMEPWSVYLPRSSRHFGGVAATRPLAKTPASSRSPGRSLVYLKGAQTAIHAAAWWYRAADHPARPADTRHRFPRRQWAPAGAGSAAWPTRALGVGAGGCNGGRTLGARARDVADSG